MLRRVPHAGSSSSRQGEDHASRVQWVAVREAGERQCRRPLPPPFLMRSKQSRSKRESVRLAFSLRASSTPRSIPSPG